MRNKKIGKTHAKENYYTHKTIFTWFGILPMFTELQGFHYYQGRIQGAAIVFPHSEKHGNNTHHKTLITKLLLHKTGDVHEIYTIKYSHIYIFSLTFMLFCD